MQSKNHNKIKRDIGHHILNGLNFNIKQRETSKATHPNIFYFILFFSLLTLPNNKISETTKQSVHICTGEQMGTPQQQVPSTVGPRHRLLKMSKLQTSGDVPILKYG